MDIQIKILDHGKDLPLPEYKTKGAVGFDLRAAVEKDTVFVIHPGEGRVVPTGLCVAIPNEYELQVRPRSGLALNHNVSVINTPGTVDSDYRGEILVLLFNHDKEKSFIFVRGDRIAQAVVSPIIKVNFVEVDELPSTIRGDKGFGSTGI